MIVATRRQASSVRGGDFAICASIQRALTSSVTTAGGGA